MLKDTRRPIEALRAIKPPGETAFLKPPNRSARNAPAFLNICKHNNSTLNRVWAFVVDLVGLGP